jgi:hypothetical protein
VRRAEEALVIARALHRVAERLRAAAEYVEGVALWCDVAAEEPSIPAGRGIDLSKVVVSPHVRNDEVWALDLEIERGIVGRRCLICGDHGCVDGLAACAKCLDEAVHT